MKLNNNFDLNFLNNITYFDKFNYNLSNTFICNNSDISINYSNNYDEENIFYNQYIDTINISVKKIG